MDVDFTIVYTTPVDLDQTPGKFQADSDDNNSQPNKDEVVRSSVPAISPASAPPKRSIPRRMFGRKARKNRAIQSWRRAAQLIIPVAQTIGALKQASERKRRKSFNNPENIEKFDIIELMYGAEQ
uniref:Uncharacterized protein n=1 Tax=Magallana gigas TaxID=29159 RepID=K1QTL6_MAGGI